MCLSAMISDPELFGCLSISDVSIKILSTFETVTDVLNNDSIDEDVPSKKNKLAWTTEFAWDCCELETNKVHCSTCRNFQELAD